MKIFSMLLIASCFSSLSFAANLPHLPPDMDGFEYRNLFAPHSVWRPEVQQDDPLGDILALGKRNLSWLETVNAARPHDTRLELTTPGTTVGYPLEQPNESNRSIIQKRRDEVLAAMPLEMRDVLLGESDLPTHPTLPDDVFLEHVRAFDKVYQAASRWLLQEPMLDAYASLAAHDVRGYVHLSRVPDLTAKLLAWNAQPAETRSQWVEWLMGICANAGKTRGSCASLLANAVERDGHPVSFRDEHWSFAEARHSEMFAIQNPRNDASYPSDGGDDFVLPFADPQNETIAEWLKSNIENEWRLDAFQVRLKFEAPGRRDLAHVVFEPGATPHVDGLGGSRITMDANRSLDEYLERWTIRHEFGHVLGFPDCYVEFYDRQRGVMINYQIDLNNIMCSRLGHLMPLHQDEIKRAYKNQTSGQAPL